MSKPACSIIIRSFNEQKHIGRLIEGIKKQVVDTTVEVILVDSGSTDATVQIAKQKGATIIYIKPEDFSFGRALNIGCKAASGDILLFASAHVYPLYTNWIEKMLAPFKDEKVSLVYGKQVGNELTKYSEHQLFKKWFPKESNYRQEIPFCNNANAAIRKTLWEIQPFDELLTGLEDLDWASKIKEKGYYIAYESLAPIVHVHEETPQRIKNRYRREAIALKKIFPKEKFSFIDFLRLSSTNIFTDSFHAIHDKVFFKQFKGILQFRIMQFWGTYQGYRQLEVNKSLKQRLYYPNQFKKQSYSEAELEEMAIGGEKIIYNAIES